VHTAASAIRALTRITLLLDIFLRVRQFVAQWDNRPLIYKVFFAR
jgi:hypothetical protein